MRAVVEWDGFLRSVRDGPQHVWYCPVAVGLPYTPFDWIRILTGHGDATRSILDDPIPAAMPRAIEANAVEGCKAWAAWPGLVLHDDPDLTWTLSDIAFPLFNNVLSARIAPPALDSAIDAVIQRAEARNVPVSWWTGPSTRPAEIGPRLEARGFALVATPTGMAVDLHDVPASEGSVPGLTIDEVADVDALETWCRIMGSVFQFPDFAIEAWCRMLAAIGVGRGQAWRYYTGRLDGVPVATSALFLGAGVAGIASVATVSIARRRGIASAMTLEPLCEARRLGYRIGTLCSSAMAETVYGRLGFRPYCRMGMYIREE